MYKTSAKDTPHLTIDKYMKILTQKKKDEPLFEVRPSFQISSYLFRNPMQFSKKSSTKAISR